LEGESRKQGERRTQEGNRKKLSYVVRVTEKKGVKKSERTNKMFTLEAKERGTYKNYRGEGQQASTPQKKKIKH